MAEANESRGLKIAVSAFITLTVILAVTSYFLYSSVLSAQARRDSEQYAHVNAKRMASLALMQYDEMRARIGTKAEEFDPAREEISANFKNVDERLNNLINTVNAAVQTAQQNGAQGPELEDAKLNVQKVIASYRSEPNRNYISSLERLTELAEKLAILTTQLSRNYVGVRKSVEGATNVAKGQKDQGPTRKDPGPTTKD
jgi:hypothetical protein